MDTSLWSVEGNNKARLDAPLTLAHPRVLAAAESLASSHAGLGGLQGAFRSTPMQPHAGIPIFGLVFSIGIAVVALAVWLAIFDRNGILAKGLNARVIVVGSVLSIMGVGLVLYGGRKLQRLMRDYRQLLLVFDNGVVHIHPDRTNVYFCSHIREVRHQCVALDYGGMSTGTEHAYLVIDVEGRELVLLGRSYTKPNDEPSGNQLTDVEQVGIFLASEKKRGRDSN